MNEPIKKMLCKIAKNDVNELKKKKELTPQEFSKIALYEIYISQGCKPKPKRKKSEIDKIKELRKKLYG